MQDIKPLIVFAAVLEHGSMNAAAAALDMTPSAVSQHINRLEAVHGIKLLNRSTRRLAPTDAGQALGDYCRRLSRTLADTRNAIDALKTEPAGELHLSLPSTIIDAQAFQAALARLRREFPKIKPVLHFNDALDDLQNSRFDLAIRGGDHALDDPNLVARHLFSWPYQIYASPGYLAGHPPIERPEDLQQHQWLLFQAPRLTLHREHQSCSIDLTDYIACNQLAAVRNLTVGGFGLSCQLSGEVQHLVAAGRLKNVLPEWSLPAVNVYAVTPYRIQSAKTHAAVKILQESFAQEAV
ncbi:LysR family transcriptional regulator [Bergeriella denitrificans]|uniref:LysR family transcriptional regulator n=1 Tax=Bergeriella denitrificans TaxID=494 RepID=A0A378UHW5_BERDE|nr:LysR family transcriptional regulator [Bergeriella denitrificans]STZ76974.1 LysR family transcriptional regulator [Bergeriella denitrificans]